MREQGDNRVPIVGGDPGAQDGESYRTVKGAGIGVNIAEFFGKGLGECAFPGAGGSVDGNTDHFDGSFLLNPSCEAAAFAAAIAVENAI